MRRSLLMMMAVSLAGFVACEQPPEEEMEEVPEVQEMPEAEPITPPPAGPDTMMMQPMDTMPGDTM